MNERTNNILEHMLEDAEDIMTFINEIETFEKFSNSPLYKKGVVMSILNIGELTKKLPDEFKEKYKDIPWRKVSGMRDIAAHGYHIMEDDIIWDVAKYSIPELLDFIKRILNKERT